MSALLFTAIAAAMTALALYFSLSGLFLAPDATGDAVAAATQSGQSVLSRRQVIAPALALAVAATTLYLTLGTPSSLRKIPVPVERGSVDAHQVERTISMLTAALKANPDDVDGWRRLARAYEGAHRFDLAVAVYRKLAIWRPGDADLYADYAVTLAMRGDGTLSGEPERLIRHALEIMPDNPQALALLGSAAFERGEYAAAVASWQKILLAVPAGSDMARSISAGIARAKSLAGDQ